MKTYLQRKNYNNSNNNEISLFDALDDLFKPVFYENQNGMKTDIKETQSSYVMEVEVPGFKKEDIKVSLEDGYLTVCCSKVKTEEEKNDQSSRYVRKEISESCQRSYYVGEEIEEENIKAKYENGILTLTVPKVQPKQIRNHSITIE